MKKYIDVAGYLIFWISIFVIIVPATISTNSLPLISIIIFLVVIVLAFIASFVNFYKFLRKN